MKDEKKQRLILLDTNAFFSLPTKHLNRELSISPYVFYERIRYIDQDWEKFKRVEVPKFRKVNILQDPEFILDALVTGKSDPHYGSDSERINLICDVLMDAKNIEGLNDCVIEESNGVCRRIGDIPTRTENTLSIRKAKFVRCLSQKIYSHCNNTRGFSDFENVMSLLLGRFKQTFPKTEKLSEIPESFIDQSFLYFSTIYFMTQQKNQEPQETKNDLNDYIDSLLPLHMRLNENNTLVTDDKSLGNALHDSFSLARENGLPIIKCQIYTKKEFLEHLSAYSIEQNRVNCTYSYG